MREIESRRARSGPMRGPGIADLASEASNWAEEYLASETHVQVRSAYCCELWMNVKFMVSSYCLHMLASCEITKQK